MLYFLEQVNFIFVIMLFIISLFILSKAADFLVDNAVYLSNILGMPEMIIGATIVSIGTTLPEFSASVAASLQGNTEFALGNAIGSIITNTSLVMGVAALFGMIPVTKQAAQKLSILNLTVLLVIIPAVFQKAKYPEVIFPQWVGVIFILLIPVYFTYLISRKTKDSTTTAKAGEEKIAASQILLTIFKLLTSAILVALSSSAMVSSAEIVAMKIGVPDVLIASTIVALGTSIPELTTAIAAAKHNHGGLALGNIMGANILNILLVTGASISLSPGGISIPVSIIAIHFPALVFVLAFFGYFAYNNSKNHISNNEGLMLIFIYIIYLAANIITA